MVASSELENIVKPENKSQPSLKHKLKVLAVAVPLALMSYAPAATGQEAQATRPAEKKEIITVVPYTDLRGTYGASVSLGKINNGKGFRAGFFAETKKNQNIHYAPFLQYPDDYYWDISSDKLSLGATADWLIGKPDSLLVGLGGGLGLELTQSNHNLHDTIIMHDTIIIIDNASSSSNSLENTSSRHTKYIYSSGDKNNLFVRLQASASYPLSKKLLLGIQAGADLGRRPDYEFLENYWPDVFRTWIRGPDPKHRNNMVLGLSLTYVIK